MNIPRLTRSMAATSFLYLAAGFSLGGSLLIHKGTPLHPQLWSLLPAHVDMLLWGWISQLTFAVAYWIFPRFHHQPQRGNPTPQWIGFTALNLGIWLTVLDPFLFLSPWIPFAARVLQLGGASMLALSLWRRIRPYQR